MVTVVLRLRGVYGPSYEYPWRFRASPGASNGWGRMDYVRMRILMPM